MPEHQRLNAGPGASAPGLSLFMSKTLDVTDLARINETLNKMPMKEILTFVHNNTCAEGLQVQYIGNGMWEFLNPEAVQKVLDAKRCGLDA
jgi:hypothetical protein